MISLDAIHFCYRNLKATQFVIDRFRENFPDSNIALIVDKGGLDFSEYANSKRLHIIENFDYNLGGTGPNAYLESVRAIALLDRIRRALETLESKNVMILEDDVYVKRRFEFSAEDLPAGQLASSNRFPSHIAQRWFGFEAMWGMGGGSMMSREFFLSKHDEIVEWTKSNHDVLMREFNCIGAGDCFMSFHFARHGKKISPAPWLADGSVIHPYKNLYPPGWSSSNQVEW